jgi:pilus assembly protein CpaD
MSLNSRLLILAAVSAGLTLSACASDTRIDDKGAKVAIARTPTEQFQLKTEERPDSLLFAPHEAGLSPGQQSAAQDYARRWAERGSSDILIEAATTGGRGAYTTSHAAAELMISQGVPAEVIHIVGYDAGPDAPVRITFQSPEAMVDDCNRSWDRLTATGSNQPYANFGCVTKANLAAMIANPTDIDHPRAMQPADAARRQVVLDKYRNGEVTSSAKDPQASGAVSKAIQ